MILRSLDNCLLDEASYFGTLMYQYKPQVPQICVWHLHGAVTDTAWCDLFSVIFCASEHVCDRCSCYVFFFLKSGLKIATPKEKIIFVSVMIHTQAQDSLSLRHQYQSRTKKFFECGIFGLYFIRKILLKTKKNNFFGKRDFCEALFFPGGARTKILPAGCFNFHSSRCPACLSQLCSLKRRLFWCCMPHKPRACHFAGED